MRKNWLLLSAVLLVSAGHAQVTVSRDDAVNNPSKHAWNLFLLLNHPAKDPSLGRGVPDLNKKIGEAGATSVWETWRLSRTEVFLERGVEPPAWDDLSLPGGPTTGKVPELPKAELIKRLNKKLGPGGRLPSGRSGLRPLFDESEGIFSGQGGFGESRMNRATYDFVKTQKLYSVEGQQRYAAEFLAGRKPNLSFPLDSIEVKAAWIEFSPADVAAGKDKRYYRAELKGKTYGLIALHIITKDIPNWFWSTFHHVDNPANEFETVDSYGQPKQLLGTVWENYKLGGVQTEFVDAIGRPTLLSDHYIEFGFTRSSCISCHARATAAALGSSARPLGSTVVIGVPDTNLYLQGGKQVLMQTDFLFSLPLRALSEQGPALSGSATKKK